ncbi:MAG: Rpn family recombination-promoting nuclease/putative transposase [Cyanobacteriota bacterium]|nr:Rpn family recombination-promoting nuclease/putative transposase [Cyanobacteriota bacterium]
MVFINPKTDFAFKKIFGSEQSKDILISFLKALLYDGEEIIEDLEILNPYQAPRIKGVKDTYLDVKARLKGGKTVIIEMQVLNVEGFEKRILYNAAKAYSIQLSRGEEYALLNPVIALTITDFKMFEFEKMISAFVLKEKKLFTDYTENDIELVFVELPKFKKKVDELKTLTDKWLYFLKEARKLESIPLQMQDIDQIKDAFEIAMETNMSAAELEELQRREIFIQDQQNAIKLARRLGREEGKKESSVEIAQRLLSVLDDEAISQATGLSLEEVKKLRENN